jgi:hypothetical protein
MRILKLFLISTLFYSQAYGQSEPIAFVNFYEKVIEFTFDNQTQNYEKVREIIESGAISVDKTKIFIKGYDNQPDKTFKIISKDYDNKSQRDMYTCILEGKEYIVAITRDKRYLTQIGLDDKYIYELQSDDNTQKRESQVIVIDKEKINKNTDPIYIYGTVDKNPLFDTAKDDTETKELINRYVTQKSKELKWNKKGKSYIQLIIDKNGKVIYSKIVYGKDEKFNDFAIKTIQSMPDWKPGEKNGEKVKIQHTIEVKIE